MAETPQTNEGDAAKDEITPADANVAAEAQDAAEESAPPGEEAAAPGAAAAAAAGGPKRKISELSARIAKDMQSLGGSN